MALLDTTVFDFSHEAASTRSEAGRREAVIRNDDERAVLHIGVRSPAPWLEIYPTEMALAPGSSQAIVAQLRPERSRGDFLTPVTVTLFGQYIAVRADDAGRLPPDLEAHIRVTPPLANCPTCGADLGEGARECRRCGERIRICPICGTPNTWLAVACRVNAEHVIRPEMDWIASPGGNAAHGGAVPGSSGIHLARRWSSPAFASSRPDESLEWSAPLLAFGMVVGSAIDAAAGTAGVHAYELESGTPLWDFDLPDPRGIYPDRGAMALAGDGALYAGTLAGQIVAIDCIRGTRRWGLDTKGAIYGGLVAAGSLLFAPAGNSLVVIDRVKGEIVRSHTLGGRLDCAPAFADGVVYVSCDDSAVYAFNTDDGTEKWRAVADGAFDAAPVVGADLLFTASVAGSVYGIRRDTGEIKWKTQATARGIMVSPALSPDNLLFAAADDGYIHILDGATGHLIRSRRVSTAPLHCAPVYSGGMVYVGADDGSIYTLDADYNVHRAYETTAGARIASAGLAVYGNTLACTATNGLLYVLRMQN